ncbi:13500_t:CDS:2, partial [Dentiscutata heterogama]
MTGRKFYNDSNRSDILSIITILSIIILNIINWVTTIFTLSSDQDHPDVKLFILQAIFWLIGGVCSFLYTFIPVLKTLFDSLKVNFNDTNINVNNEVNIKVDNDININIDNDPNVDINNDTNINMGNNPNVDINNDIKIDVDNDNTGKDYRISDNENNKETVYIENIIENNDESISNNNDSLNDNSTNDLVEISNSEIIIANSNFENIITNTFSIYPITLKNASIEFSQNPSMPFDPISNSIDFILRTFL